jgi:glycosyltransferase involved in cell wall biosynthesis
MRIICLSWHPGNSGYIISGGYRRFYEIAKRSPVEMLIIDSEPTLYNDLSHHKISYKPWSNLRLGFLNHLVVRVSTVWQVLRILLKESYNDDVIYVPDSELSHLTLPAILLKVLKGNRVVLADLNVNTIWPERLLNIILHKFADKVITISKSLKLDLDNSGIKASDINGVGFNKQEFNIRDTNKLYDAVFIGRHIPQKGIWDLLEILKIIIVTLPNFKLVTIGNTPSHLKQEIADKIHALNLDDNILLLGDISDSEKKTILDQSKIMVFPSHQEGWGIAPMEALSKGLPVIAYNLPVYEESIGESGAFRVVSVGDVKKFAQITLETLTNAIKYKNIALQWNPISDWDAIAKRELAILCSN